MKSLLLFFTLFSFVVNAQVSCDSMISEMEEMWSEIKLLSYRTVKTERVGDELVTKDMFFVVQSEPFKVALELEDDGDRDFVLYDPLINPMEVLFIPDGFPYKNLRLNIQSNWVRGDNHYSITNAGFEFIIQLIRDQYEALTERIDCCEETRDGVDYYCYKAEAKDFAYVTYKCEEHVSVDELALKLGVNPYLLLERNASLSEYSDDCFGKELTVPNLYGRRIEILVHAKHMLPSSIRIEDDRGLLEELIYSEFNTSIELPADYFTEDHLESLE